MADVRGAASTDQRPAPLTPARVGPPATPDTTRARFTDRLPTLDGLRGLAILGVMLHNLDVLDAPANTVIQVLGLAINRGWMGVQLFFVLSGFLITGILLDSRRDAASLRHFFQRRILRIFPLYYLSLMVLLLIVPALGLQVSACADGGSQAPYWLFYANWTQPYLAHESDCIDQFWSLAVEEQFYLLWPLLLWACPRPRQALWLCLAVTGLALLARLLMWAWEAPPAAVYQFTITRMDALALGGAAAALWRLPGWGTWLRRHAGLSLWGAVFVLTVGLVITRGYPRLSETGQVWGYLLSALGLAIVVLAAAALDGSQRGPEVGPGVDPGVSPGIAAAPGGLERLGRGLLGLLRVMPLRRLGRYSFALYVVHKPVSFLLVQPMAARWLGPEAWPDRHSLLSGLGFTLVVSVISLALAMASWRWIERPLLAQGRGPAKMRDALRTRGG